MAKKLVELGPLKRLLNIASYGRRAPRNPPVAPTLPKATARSRMAPEVMIKVSGGSRTVAGVRAHLNYIGRNGKGVIEADDGYGAQFKGFEKYLVTQWDLDLAAIPRKGNRSVASGRKAPKLVHNLVFSMPRNTPVDSLHRAVRKFAQEEFGAKHRYAMAVHTDQSHPHVHVVVKAVGENGERLNIRKATLRQWRQRFATHLREQGVEATATPRRERGLAPSYRSRNPKWPTAERETFLHRSPLAVPDRASQDRGFERER